jgi:probable rRNA maturation factor
MRPPTRAWTRGLASRRPSTGAVTVREAAEAGKSVEAHVLHLLVHGVLHLLGFDHIRDKDATLMEGIETEILGKMGVADPYREEDGV